MEYKKLLETADKLDNIIEKIKSNHSDSYIWYSVKGKGGCLYELGGRNKHVFELKAHIPSREDNKYMVHENGFIKSEYSITDWGYLEFPSFRVKLKCSFDTTKMIEFLKKTNFKTYYPKIKSKQVIKEYETIYYM